MYEPKTKVTEVKPLDFINQVEDEKKRKDSLVILKMFKEITGEKPKMWGPSMIGFGKYHYKYESGHEGDCFITGFSPRKQALTLYVLGNFKGKDELLAKLGKYKNGKSCLYIKKLEDVDLSVLRKLIEQGYKHWKSLPGAQS
ncbi:MAG TPA: DUF1801 domain-containing protein [Bacteroidetes bacterium]|nr:DUF1801 domain-containing protein [Bacteroidota bacterium]HCN37903.1 DUF1801 domain-containing protein [Bacteroidota bacterium]